MTTNNNNMGKQITRVLQLQAMKSQIRQVKIDTIKARDTAISIECTDEFMNGVNDHCIEMINTGMVKAYDECLSYLDTAIEIVMSGDDTEDNEKKCDDCSNCNQCDEDAANSLEVLRKVVLDLLND